MFLTLTSRLRLVVVASACLLLTGVADAASYHTVQKGDTLYSLARKYQTKVSTIMSANGISDPTKLRVGQKLRLSSGGTSASSSSASRSTSSSSVRNTGRGRRVIIDAGHGGRDYGAYYRGVRESDLNLRVATKLESLLKQRGYAVTMTRRSDVFISLSRRAAIANNYRNAIFVSIHFNATSASWVRGAETYYAGSSKGRALASAIQSQLVSRLKVRNRGVRFSRFTVLTATRCPAVLVECGFISNAAERQRCSTSSYQSTAALAIAEGIARYRW
jgi:N-acetylmuramoyl-L-alanine amidase